MSETETPPPPSRPAFSPAVAKWLPVAIFAAALLLRIWGIAWGIPSAERHWSYHPDESVVYLYAQQVEPAALDFDPGFYNYGTLYLTILRIAGDVAKTYAGAGDQLWMQMGAGHIAGRWISALAGAGTALVLYVLLRRRYGDFPALFGALLVAFAPGHVVHSRFQTVDVLATFLLVLSAHFALKLLPGLAEAAANGKLAIKAAALSGFFAGLSAGTKYTGILALLTLFVAVWFGPKPDRLRLAGMGVGAAVLVFLITTPGVFMNSAKFMEDFRYEMQHTSQGHGLVFAGLPNGFAWHLYNLVVGVGPILLLLGLAGLAVACFRKEPAALALAAFFLVYYILIGRAEVLFLRYTFPLLLGLAFGLAWLVNWSADKGKPHRIWPALGIVGLGGVFGGGLAGSGGTAVWMAGEDPRDQAAAFLREEAKKDPELVVGLVSDPWYYTPPFYPESGAPRGVPFADRNMAMLGATEPRVRRFVPENPDDRFDWDLRLLEEIRPQFVLFSSFETEGLTRLLSLTGLTELERLLTDRLKAFRTKLEADYVPSQAFGGTGWGIHDMDYIQPRIEIWKRRTP